MKSICLFENVLVSGTRYGAGKQELEDETADRIIDAGLGVLIVADPKPEVVEQPEEAVEEVVAEAEPAEPKTAQKAQAKKTAQKPKANKPKAQKAEAMDEAFAPIPEAEAE